MQRLNNQSYRLYTYINKNLQTFFRQSMSISLGYNMHTFFVKKRRKYYYIYIRKYEDALYTYARRISFSRIDLKSLN